MTASPIACTLHTLPCKGPRLSPVIVQQMPGVLPKRCSWACETGVLYASKQRKL